MAKPLYIEPMLPTVSKMMMRLSRSIRSAFFTSRRPHNFPKTHSITQRFPCTESFVVPLVAYALTLSLSPLRRLSIKFLDNTSFFAPSWIKASTPPLPQKGSFTLDALTPFQSGSDTTCSTFIRTVPFIDGSNSAESNFWRYCLKTNAKSALTVTTGFCLSVAREIFQRFFFVTETAAFGENLFRHDALLSRVLGLELDRYFYTARARSILAHNIADRGGF